MKHNIPDSLINITDYVVALSSTVDTLNVVTRDKFITANNLDITKINDFEYLTAEATKILREDILPDFQNKGFTVVDSVGYWEGKEQPNSFLVVMPKTEAEYYVKFANELLGQDSIIAFGPGCNAEVLDQPADYCTKVGDKWIRYDFEGVVLESKKLSKKLLKESTIPENYNVEHLVNLAYQVAGNIFFRKEWPTSLYSREDFMQEAAMYMITKWDEGYFEGKDAKDITPMVVGMLNNWFIRNKNQQARTSPTYRKTKETNIQGVQRFHDEDTPTDKYSRSIARQLTATEENPEEYTDLETDKHAGNLIIVKLTNELSKEPYATRKHTYQANVPELGTVRLSPWVIARMILLGYTNIEIAHMFAGLIPGSGVHFTADPKGSYVAKRVAAVINILAEKFNKLSDEEIRVVKVAIKGKLPEKGEPF